MAMHASDGRARHLVWDWNGTLFDDIDAVTAATNEILADRGVAPLTTDEHRRTFTRPVWVFYERMLNRNLADGEFERLDRAFHEAYDREMVACTLAADAEPAMRAWRAGGRTQSLLSMAQHDALMKAVTKHNIERYFDRVDGLRGEAGGRKAEHLASHLDTLGADPTSTLVVGDSVDDADAAAHVGARCVLYTGGFMSVEALRGAGVPVVDTLTEALNHA